MPFAVCAALKAAKDGKTVAEIAHLVRYEEERFDPSSAAKSSIATAAREGNTNAVARLLQAGADFTAHDGWWCSYYGLPHTPLPGPRINGDSALKAAVDGGHLEVLRQLLDAEKDITSVPGFYSDVALKTAVETDNHQEVLRLQEAAKTLKRATENKQSALFAATVVGNLEMMRSLISAGAEVENSLFTGNECSLLATASGGGHLDIVEFLLRTVENGGRGEAICAAAGAGHRDIFETLVQDMVEVDSTTLDDALGSAVFNGHRSIIRRLLDLGASSDARFYYLNEWTDLELAALRDDVDLAKTLLSAGADVNACTEAEGTGTSALQVAAEHGSVALVQLLLGAGADVNAPPSGLGGCTALQSACKGGRDETVRFLLLAGATITEKDSTIRRAAGFKSGLEYAAMGGHETVVETLLQHIESLDESLTNTIRLEALIEAIQANHMTIAKRLLATNVLFNNHIRIRRLLPGAAEAGDLDVVRMLLEAPANGTQSTDTRDYWRFPDRALLVAVEHEHLEIVKLLLAAGLDVGVDDGDAGPVLHMAAAKGNLSITQLLLDYGADLTAVSYDDAIALLQAAERSGNAETVKLLKSRFQVLSHGMVVNGADKAHKVLQRQQGGGSWLCPECSRIPLEVFMGRKENGYWHTSLTSLQSSVQIGCPFCTFLWRQLGIQNIDILQVYRVSLSHNFYRSLPGDMMWSNINGPQSIQVAFHIVTSPFKGE